MVACSKQVVCDGGHTWLLDHKNWKFEKFMTLKIQTDELKQIQATSADNINLNVTSTVNWRVTDVQVAACMAAETMATSGKVADVSSDLTKLRGDVLQQAIASLAAFIGGVNYSESFHMSAAAAGNRGSTSGQAVAVGQPVDDIQETSNPLYDLSKMDTAVEHANKITATYGVEIMSINIISAVPLDSELTKSLASGAVASAEALQAETAARGQANALKIQAEADAEMVRIKAESEKDAVLIVAEGSKEAELLRAEGEAKGLRTVAEAYNAPGGQAVMTQRVAESYVNQMAEMSKNAKLIVVPDRPNDVSGVITAAFGVSDTLREVAKTSLKKS